MQLIRQRRGRAAMVRPMLQITIRTSKGKAGVVSRQEWTTPGPFSVFGMAAVTARRWLEETVGRQASPRTIYAAVRSTDNLAEHGISLLNIEITHQDRKRQSWPEATGGQSCPI